MRPGRLGAALAAGALALAASGAASGAAGGASSGERPGGLEARWYYMASVTDSALVLVDWESVSRAGSTARVIFALKDLRDNPSGRQHAYLTGEDSFDCAGNRYKVSGSYRSDVGYRPISEPAGAGEWRAVPPGSAVEKIIEVVCDTSKAREDGFVNADLVEVRTRFLKGEFTDGE